MASGHVFCLRRYSSGSSLFMTHMMLRDWRCDNPLRRRFLSSHNRTHLGLWLAPAQPENQLTSARASLFGCHPTNSQKDTDQEPRMPWLETFWSGQCEPAFPMSLQCPSFEPPHCLTEQSRSSLRKIAGQARRLWAEGCVILAGGPALEQEASETGKILVFKKACLFLSGLLK